MRQKCLIFRHLFRSYDAMPVITEVWTVQWDDFCMGMYRQCKHPQMSAKVNPQKTRGAKERFYVEIANNQVQKEQAKHKVFGRDIPGTSGSQTSGYPGQNFMQVAFFCCFRQGGAWMSRDLGRDVPDLEKLYARKLWADFSYPK